MSKLTEMEAKLRKGPSMFGHAKFHARLQDHVIELATSVDALTAERDALRAELARVKAESLRVVVTGEPVRLGGWLEEGEVKNFTHDGQVQYIEPEDGLQVDMNHEECGVPIGDDDLIYPVRLERWEDE